MNAKDVVNQIFRAGIESVQPDKMIRNILKIENDILSISDVNIPLDKTDHIYVIGAGKASALMAKEVESMLGDRITKGHIIVKHGYGCKLDYIQVTEGGHPMPDNNGFRATSDLVELAKKARKNDLVICLISGGGSSLLTDLPDGIEMEELIKLNRLLINCGAGIKEINTIRKHVSNVKGGQLARAVYPAGLVSLIVSDVTGNPLDMIASGPTSPDSGTFQEALDVLEKYHLTEKIPTAIFRHLTKGQQGKIPETPKQGDPVFKNVHNLIIGSNLIALVAAKNKASQLGYLTVILNTELESETSNAAEYIIRTALGIQKNILLQHPVCLLFGGETTLQVTGPGLGGRNQHLALKAACLLSGTRGITILSAGTDGTDGPTDAAGAVVDGTTFKNAVLKNSAPESYLNNFDSYSFFKKNGGHIITGPTLTNVMDLMVVLIE